jgi:hypothetical protein
MDGILRISEKGNCEALNITSLTKTTTSESGTEITVEDAGFFVMASALQKEIRFN